MKITQTIIDPIPPAARSPAASPVPTYVNNVDAFLSPVMIEHSLQTSDLPLDNQVTAGIQHGLGPVERIPGPTTLPTRSLLGLVAAVMENLLAGAST